MATVDITRIKGLREDSDIKQKDSSLTQKKHGNPFRVLSVLWVPNIL